MKWDAENNRVSSTDESVIKYEASIIDEIFEQYSARDLSRKISRIRDNVDNLTVEDVKAGLRDFGQNEDDLITKFKNDSLFLDAIRASCDKKIDSPECVKSSPIIKHSKFKVDEGLDMLNNGSDPSKVFEGWSKARINAHRHIATKPNAYYYRFNAPGEKQGSGAWNAEEKKKFLERTKEVGASGQWGIFSIGIPGRVGYQCANYYRQLVKTGEVSDPNYNIDEKGELHYLFGKKEGGEGVVRSYARTGHAASQREISDDPKKSNKGKKRAYNEDLDKSDTFISYSRSFRPAKKDVPIIDEIFSNPLPGFIDPITMQKVLKPAISPYGHVMGYDTWVRCISQEPKNTCPITKKPVTKRELILLTYDNIEEFRLKIK